MYLYHAFLPFCKDQSHRINPKQCGPYPEDQKNGPLFKIALFEEDIWVNKDEEVGSIGPRATSTVYAALLASPQAFDLNRNTLFSSQKILV